MLRLQDILFGVLVVAVLVLMACDLQAGVLALLGAFLCGGLYVFVGMIPARTDAFWSRLGTTMFLAIVLSCIVLIVPGTFGAHRLNLQGPVLTIAALLPVAALCFEVIRTPRVVETILRSLGRR